MTVQESISVIQMTSAAYNKRIDAQSTVLIWAAEFADVPVEEVANAVKIHIARSKYFPAVSEIKAIISEQVHDSKILRIQTETSSEISELVNRLWDSLVGDDDE